MQNKSHWYDGKFYDKLIAPNQDRLFNKILEMIEPGSSALDIGCGTGRLCFKLSDRIKNVVGIDLSKSNINLANKLLLKKNMSNVSFVHGDAQTLNLSVHGKFDYVIFTYVIHEMSESERINALKSAIKFGNHLIIGDYIYPHPNSFWGYLNVVVEYLAGKEHYNNFKDYIDRKGLPGLMNRVGMKITDEIKNEPATSHLIRVSY